MNISFLFETPIRQNAGGIERVTMLLANEFQRMGHRVLFISTSDGNENASSFHKQICFNGLAPDSKQVLKNILLKNNVEIVINQSVIFSTLNLLPYIKETGIPIITVLHNRPFPTLGCANIELTHSYPTDLKGKLVKHFGMLFPTLYQSFRKRQVANLYKSIVTNSDQFLLLSEKFIPRLKKYCPNIDMTKIGAINNPNTFSQPKEESFIKDNLVIFVGRLIDPQKNVKGFIDVWKDFHYQNPTWKAIIIGDGPHRNIFENYALKTKCKNLVFAGNQENVATFYSKAKFLCMTSLYEGWPMVLAEALAYGCIPLVYDTFEACHEIINEHTGIITSPNPNEMSSALSQIANDETRRIAMMHSASESIQRFNPPLIAERWVQIFQRIMGKSRT